ncbi:MAG: BTB/POZ domain-containing protein [Colwellia sp.]|nr:BTB/POZ domain-containing protein [Colwellia sp.]
MTNIILLDVGGTIFKTSLSTITNKGESMLSTWLNSGDWNGSSQDDDPKPYFIDRDPTYFIYILNWLRGYSFPVYDGTKEELRLINSILQENEFYLFEGLNDECNQIILHDFENSQNDNPEQVTSIKRSGITKDFGNRSVSWNCFGSFNEIRGRIQYVDPKVQKQSMTMSASDFLNARISKLQFIPTIKVVDCLVNFLGVTTETEIPNLFLVIRHHLELYGKKHNLFENKVVKNLHYYYNSDNESENTTIKILHLDSYLQTALNTFYNTVTLDTEDVERLYIYNNDYNLIFLREIIGPLTTEIKYFDGEPFENI